VEPNTTVCRPAAGECDAQETCNGVGKFCPPDGFDPSGTPCTDDGEVCTVDECDGAGACTHPAGNAGTECRADTGECDVAEVCDGSSTTCPADGFESSGTPCGDGSDTDCTNPDTCDGANACQSNDEPDGLMCDDGDITTAGDMCTSGICEGIVVAGTLDNYKCYKAKDLKDPAFASQLVDLDDQFQNENGVDVKKPFLFCNPAEVNGGGINNATDHLTCYKIKGGTLSPRPHVEIDNIFGTARLEVKKGFLLCVPSSKTILP
jgi:hypothetical protein